MYDQTRVSRTLVVLIFISQIFSTYSLVWLCNFFNGKKAAYKILVKLTAGANISNILCIVNL